MCDCMKQLNEHFAQTGLQLAQTLTLKDGLLPNARIELEMIDQKGRKRSVKPDVLASYCPFCGEKYPERK